MRTWFDIPYRSTLATLLVLGAAPTVTADSTGTTVPSRLTLNPVLETRLVVDSGGCPRAVEVWIYNTRDTIQGAEIVLMWDRPDYARFRTDSTPSTVTEADLIPGESSSGNAKAQMRPVIDRSGGLMNTWDYVEARGAEGLSVKVTALAYLVAASSAQLIPPQDSGLLFSLPIELPATPPRWIAADSVSVHASALQTRLSTDHGNLVEHLEFREARAPITNCTGTASGRR